MKLSIELKQHQNPSKRRLEIYRCDKLWFFEHYSIELT
jgi:hypothetical protein